MWNNKNNEVVTIEDTEVKILELDAGFENTKEHVDTKLILMAGDDRIVIHAYNGTSTETFLQKSSYHEINSTI